MLDIRFGVATAGSVSAQVRRSTDSFEGAGNG
jgi:hypothetical protein